VLKIVYTFASAFGERAGFYDHYAAKWAAKVL
jgi:hypothetical protein